MAGLRLAEAGWSVCLVEANPEVGGSARTLECTLPGFRHDLGAGFLPLVMAAPAIMGRDLAAFGLRSATPCSRPLTRCPEGGPSPLGAHRPRRPPPSAGSTP